MNLSRLFILRPVATTLSMIAILLAGLIAYRMLPVAALPQVDYPTIRVMTLYPGASPEVMALRAVLTASVVSFWKSAAAMAENQALGAPPCRRATTKSVSGVRFTVPGCNATEW